MRVSGVELVRAGGACGALLALSSACGWLPGSVQGKDYVSGLPWAIPSWVDPGPGAGTGCGSTEPGRICLGVDYVVYRDPAGSPLLSEDEARSNLVGINDLWRPCKFAR